MNTKGIGLGLVISRLIVGKFGGIIDFYSKPQKGSTFFYTIKVQSSGLHLQSEVTNARQTSQFLQSLSEDEDD